MSVDLIYLDPPFNSNANYNVLYSTENGKAQYRAFVDTWQWDEAASERYEQYISATGRMAYKAIEGLYCVLGPSRLSILIIRVYNGGLEGVLGSGGFDAEAIHGGVSSGWMSGMSWRRC